MFSFFNKLRSSARRATSRPLAQACRLACESLEDRTTPTASTTTLAFNATAIPAGDYLWFSSEAKVSGVGSSPVTLDVTNQTITFTAKGTTYTLDVPDSTIEFSPTTKLASTSFGANGWSDAVPSKVTGEVFLSGLGWQVPKNLPGGIKNVTWTGDFSTETAGITVKWQSAAAVYKKFTSDMAGIEVKTVADRREDVYKNSDPTGTPENFKNHVVRGGTGIGGFDWTGRYSHNVSLQPQSQTGTAVISGEVDYYNPTLEILPTASQGDTVTLTNSQGDVVATATTDANGDYSFGNLSAGTYTVSESYGGTSSSVTTGNSGTSTVNLEYIGD
jgi:hypothetical protein